MKRFKFYWEEPFEKKGKADAMINIEVPGFKKDEIKVELRNSMLTVSAQKKSHKKEKGKGFYREENFAQSFQRTMTLPDRIAPDDYEMNIKDGKIAVKKKGKKKVLRNE